MTTRIFSAASLFTLLLAGSALAGEPMPMVPATTAPIVYTINYADDYFTTPEYIERFRSAPPDLLHVGKAVPITHHWGPIRLYRGENQYTGGPGNTLSWENIALISPEALAERIETIRRTLERYHAIGIAEITPYISYHTLAGDHEKRLGFWKFYDEWERYARWAGPRPAKDPFDWLVVDAAGKFVGGSCGGYSPDYYAPLHRYRACINHPDWAEWHRRLIRMVAEVGYDGCFVDNCHPDPCYCRFCKAVFREFLDANRDTAWVARLTRGLDVDKLALDSPDVPGELVRRVRLLRTSDHLAMLRRVGREVKPGFTIFPNGNSIAECLTTGGQCDRLMFESTYSPGILVEDVPPESDEIVVAVRAGAVEPKTITHRYTVADPATRIELEADISLPSQASPGKPVEFAVEVLTVGMSDRDNDTADRFVLVLRGPDPGADAVRLALSPDTPLGAPGPTGKGQRPPATLHAQWTPTQPGDYRVEFGFHYVDGGAKSTHLARLLRDQMFRSHQAMLQFAQHMRARSICLGYDASRPGRENVQELALAEMTAFSGGGGFSSRSEPQAKYRAFFKSHPELFDGWRPAAPAAVLYAYWAGNPLSHVRPYGRRVIHDELARTHRPYVALVDASLSASAGDLAAFRAIYLVAPAYELSPGQMQGLRDWIAQGGSLVARDEAVAINGTSVAQWFGVSEEQPSASVGRGKVALWNGDEPNLPTAPIAPAAGLQRHLRFAVYGKDDRLAVHAVNYNVCLLDDARRRFDVGPTPLEVPVPPGWTAAKATCYDPDGPPESVACAIADGVARLTVPAIRAYKIVLLERVGP